MPGPQLALWSVPGSTKHWTALMPRGRGRSAKTAVFSSAMISPGLPSFWNEERGEAALARIFQSSESGEKSSSRRISRWASESANAASRESGVGAYMKVTLTPGGGQTGSVLIHSRRGFQGKRS